MLRLDIVYRCRSIARLSVDSRRALYVLVLREPVFRPDTCYHCRGIVRVSTDNRRARFIVSPREDRASKQEEKDKGKGKTKEE